MRIALALTLFLIAGGSIAMCFAVMLNPMEFGWRFNRTALKDAALIFGIFGLLYVMTFLG